MEGCGAACHNAPGSAGSHGELKASPMPNPLIYVAKRRCRSFSKLVVPVRFSSPPTRSAWLSGSEQLPGICGDEAAGRKQLKYVCPSQPFGLAVG